MTAFDAVATMEPRRIWEGIFGRIVEGERISMAVVELDAGAVVERHAHPHEQLGILLEGSMTFTVGDETRELHAGDTWRILGGTPHEATAGAAGGVVIDVFTPVREDWHALETERRRPRWP